MKKTAVALALLLYASHAQAESLPTTTTTTTINTITGNSSLLDDVIEATNAKSGLRVLGAAGIGVSMLPVSTATAVAGLVVSAASIAASTYYEATGKDPIYAAASSIASAADALFQPAYQATRATFVSPASFPNSALQYIGRDAAVGATLQSIIAFAKANPSAAGNLLALIATHTGEPDTGIGDGGAGTVFTYNGQNYKILGNWTCGYLNGNPAYDTYLGYSSGKYFFARSGNLKKCDTNLNGSPMCMAPYTATSEPANVTPTDGGIDYAGLKAALSNISGTLADEIRNAIKSVPDDQKIVSSNSSPTSLPAANDTKITNNELSNFFTANTTNVYNEYLNTVNNGGDVNTAQAAAELAKAQEEEAEKETEEKFNPLDANPFQNPYNPGPFDIPTRFTTFLQNVKSSGLFSFSTSFFDSLPGGGSPLLTIDGGQTFGIHTFDFSQSLGVGMAILKSVLFALFGFLSIRAVIMKR